jgi:hypothetical protein
LPDGPFGEALLAGRGQTRNPIVVLVPSGLLALEVDGETGRALLRELVGRGLPKTVAVRSGRVDGGVHLWFRTSSPTPVVKIELADKVTIVKDAGYLVAPPAIHATTGALYHFCSGLAPWEIGIAAFPAALLDHLARADRRRNEGERRDDTSSVEPPGRHAHLLRLAGAMRRVGAGEPTIAAALLAENARRCSPPKEQHEVRALARDVCHRYPPGEGDARA